MAPTEIRIADKLYIWKESYCGPHDDAEDVSASDIMFYVAGFNTNVVAAKIGQSGEFRGNVCAPNGISPNYNRERIQYGGTIIVTDH